MTYFTITTNILDSEGRPVELDKFYRRVLKKIRKRMGEVSNFGTCYQYETLMKLELVYETLLGGESEVRWI